MSISIPDTSDVIGTNASAASQSTSNATVFVRDFVTLSATGTNANALTLSGSNITLLMEGTAISSSSTGILFNSNSEILITEDGSVASGNTGLQGVGADNELTNNGSIVSNATGVAMAGTGHTVTNNGTILAGAGDGGILVIQGFSQVLNAGTITSGTDGIVVGGNGTTSDSVVANAASGVINADDHGLRLSNADIIVTNDGLISADRDGIHTATSASSGYQITNTGTITGGDDGLFLRGGFHVITNSGAIAGADFGIRVEEIANTITNTGTISGHDQDGIFLENAGSTIHNAGEINAHVQGIRALAAGGSTSSSTNGDHTISNDGAITADTGSGILVHGTGNSIVNTGTIAADNYAIRIIGEGTIANSGAITSASNDGAITAGVVNSTRNLVQNTGTIVNEDGRGIVVRGSVGTISNSGDITVGDTGIWADGAGMRVTNTGTITTEDEGIFISQNGIIDNHGVVNAATFGLYVGGAASGDSRVLNTGTVTVSDTVAVNLAAGGGLIEFLNTGIVWAEFNAVRTTAAAEGMVRIRNEGSITTATGDAILGGFGRDIMDNDGVIVGNVRLGNSNDRFDAGTGTLDGTVFGENGDDTAVLSQAAASGRLQFDGGANAAAGDTLDLSGFETAVWVDFQYFGVEAWTRNDNDLQSGNRWVTIADVVNVENVVGSVGVDFLRGNASDNTFGYVGAQRLPGIETMVGRGGSDTADFSRSEGAVWVDLNFGATAGRAEAWTQDDTDAVDNGGVWREIVDFDSIENVVGTVALDVMLGTSGANTFGYLGSATITGTEVINGRGGTDTVDFSRFESAVWIDLQFETSSGNGEAWTQDDANALNSSAGTWREIANLDGIENIVGTEFSDYVIGDGNDNVVDGGTGDQDATDELSGRGGNDTFVFRGDFGSTTITDFAAVDAEKIDLSGVATITSFFDLVNDHLINLGGTAVIDDDSGAAVGNAITLTGYTTEDFGAGLDLSEDDFIF